MELLFFLFMQAFNDYYNSEHNRLLKMWKEVVSVKRMFKEMASVTKMDLGKLRCEIAGTTREVGGACSGVSVSLRNASKVDVSERFFLLRNYSEKRFF
jgi:rootletin